MAVTLLGGTEDFASAIVAQLLAVNAATFIGLLALNWLVEQAGLATIPAGRVALNG
jgi:hypothetical protein